MPLDHFDIIAGLYDRAANFVVTERMLRLLDLPKDGALLDLGGGTGRVSSQLRSLTGDVVVADRSMGMLHRSSARNMNAVRATAHLLPFPDGRFDRALMVDAFHHVQHQDQTADELWRVLRPNGRILIVEPYIRYFSVKMIALMETLLFMHSHFLPVEQIVEMFKFPNAEHPIVEYEARTIWVLIQKKPGSPVA